MNKPYDLLQFLGLFFIILPIAIFMLLAIAEIDGDTIYAVPLVVVLSICSWAAALSILS